MLGECLLISCLPGKALRTLVDNVRLEPGILFISSLQPSDHDIIIEFCIDTALLETHSKNATSS